MQQFQTGMTKISQGKFFIGGQMIQLELRKQYLLITQKILLEDQLIELIQLAYNEKYVNFKVKQKQYIASQGFKAYEHSKGRDSDEQLWECPKIVTSFLRGSEFDDVPGGRNGKCGTRKDNKRIYCCQGCKTVRM